MAFDHLAVASPGHVLFAKGELVIYLTMAGEADGIRAFSLVLFVEQAR